jgi:hypothetical protein
MSIPVTRLIAHVEANGIGTANEALVHFDFLASSPLTTGEMAARVIAYLSGPGEVALDTIITGIDVILPGAAGAIPQPFPAVAYAAIKATNSFLVAMSAYGVTYGSGDLTPVGTSVTVSLYTGLAGRSGMGRHYRPWPSKAVIDGAGELASAYVAGIEEAYNACFLAMGGVTWTAVPTVAMAAVYSPKLGVENQVVVPRVSQEFARLRSRQR